MRWVTSIKPNKKRGMGPKFYLQFIVAEVTIVNIDDVDN